MNLIPSPSFEYSSSTQMCGTTEFKRRFVFATNVRILYYLIEEMQKEQTDKLKDRSKFRPD